MRRTVLVVALTAVGCLALATVSGAMPGDKTTKRDAPILGIAASGTFVAATFDQGTTECFHAELWNTASNKANNLGKKVACQAPGGIRGPAVVGNRAVWATNVGGNLRDWTVWTATTTSPAPKALATVLGVDASDPDPVVIGRAGGGIVAYAVGAKITALRANGSTAWTQTSPSPVRLLASGDIAGQSSVTVAINTDDTASVIDATGAITSSGTATGILAECLQKTGGVAQISGIIGDTAANPPKMYPVSKKARLLGCAPGIVIYSVGSTIKGIRRATGKSATLLTGATTAAISPKGLAWATGSTLLWRPAATAFAPLG